MNASLYKLCKNVLACAIISFIASETCAYTRSHRLDEAKKNLAKVCELVKNHRSPRAITEQVVVAPSVAAQELQIQEIVALLNLLRLQLAAVINQLGDLSNLSLEIQLLMEAMAQVQLGIANLQLGQQQILTILQEIQDSL
jgi:hypothetical protein